MPVLTAVSGHATGDVYPASDYNTFTRDNINFLIQPGANAASAATFVPTNEFHIVTGATTLANLAPVSPVVGQRHRLLFQNSLLIQNNGGGTGNIRFLGGNDHVTQPNEIVTFIYDGANFWAVSTSVGGGGIEWSSYFDVSNTVAMTTIFTQAIPSNLLATNGVLDIDIGADYANASGASKTLLVQISYGATLLWGQTITAITSSGIHRKFRLAAKLANENGNTALQQLTGYASLSTAAAGSEGGIGALAGDFASGTVGGSSTEDSTLAKTLLIQVQHGLVTHATLDFKGTARVVYRP